MNEKQINFVVLLSAKILFCVFLVAIGLINLQAVCSSNPDACLLIRIRRDYLIIAT